MRFRPCIDIHNGAVKQIVGGSLRDSGDQARNNYVSEYDERIMLICIRETVSGEVILYC